MKIKPINNNVLIKVDDTEQTGGLEITLPKDRMKERPSEGTIEEVGDEVKKVKKGQRVLFTKHGHYQLKEEDKIIISVDDILAKIL